jgi:DNA-binding IclR family transcriptional regulator
MSKGKTRTIEAVHKTCRILDELYERRGAGVTRIAEALDLTKSSVHGHLATLEQHEYVTQEADGTYRLSMRYLAMAEQVKDRVCDYDVLTAEVDRLAEAAGEVAQFATEEHGRLTYLYKARGEDAVETRSRVGSREYLHSTGLGKAILANLPEDRVRTLLARHGTPRRTPNTVTDVDALLRELAAVRERGYAIDDEENIEGLRCAATPVHGADGSVVGALSVTGPASRMRGDRLRSELPDLLSQAANVIEINCKFS